GTMDVLSTVNYLLTTNQQLKDYVDQVLLAWTEHVDQTALTEKFRPLEQVEHTKMVPLVSTFQLPATSQTETRRLRDVRKLGEKSTRRVRRSMFHSVVSAAVSSRSWKSLFGVAPSSSSSSASV